MSWPISSIRGLLPAEGADDGRGQADLLGLCGEGGVPRLRRGGRGCSWDLGRDERQGAPLHPAPPASGRADWSLNAATDAQYRPPLSPAGALPDPPGRGLPLAFPSAEVSIRNLPGLPPCHRTANGQPCPSAQIRSREFQGVEVIRVWELRRVVVDHWVGDAGTEAAVHLSGPNNSSSAIAMHTPLTAEVRQVAEPMRAPSCLVST